MDNIVVLSTILVVGAILFVGVFALVTALIVALND
jgi:hypothetical protein